MFIRSTYILALALVLSVMVHPSLAVAWIASIIFAAHFYAYHESRAVVESLRLTHDGAITALRGDAGLRHYATFVVAGWGALLTLFYALFGGTEFALIIATAVGLTLVLRGLLPRFFDHSEIRSLS